MNVVSSFFSFVVEKMIKKGFVSLSMSARTTRVLGPWTNLAFYSVPGTVSTFWRAILVYVKTLPFNPRWQKQKATLTSDSDSTSTDDPITDNKGVNKVKITVMLKALMIGVCEDPAI